MGIAARIEPATTWTEDSRITATVGSVADDDGINAGSTSWKWQQAAPINDAAPADDSASWSDIPGATNFSFTPLQTHVGNYVRACYSFTDEYHIPATYTICTLNRLVTNVSDAPTGSDTTVNVPLGASSASPHDFDLSDFPFSDTEDGDAFNGIRLATLPSAGTLVVTSNTDLTIDQGTNLSLAQLSDLAYYPSDGATAGTNRDRFTYKVTDTGNDAATDGAIANTAATAATLTINLVDDPATGMPALAYASGITVPTEDSPITASQGTIADPSNTPPTSIGTINWQWSQADSDGGIYTDISAATNAAFTPGDAQVGMFLQVCASFTDSDGDNESRCRQIPTAVANINDPAAGAVAISTADGALSGAPDEDAALTASAAGITDPDGTANIAGSLRWHWREDGRGNGVFADIEGATGAAFTPLQAQVGNALRVCASFTDDRGSRENLCITTEPVANTNDAPMAQRRRISVSVAANASAPYAFRPQDFPFTDDDDDNLAGIILRDLPGAGTMALDGTALTAVPTETITVAQLQAGTLTYWPETGQQPTRLDTLDASYSLFRARVVDDGDGPGGDVDADKTSDISGLLAHIRLVQAEQAKATGGPRVSVHNVGVAAVCPEGSELQVRIDGIVEPNGIDESTVMWQWQQSARADGGFVDIAGATAATLTLTQAQVGMHIRACATFMDHHPTAPARESLCSSPVRTNNAPRALDSVALVPTAATVAAPYVFRASNFRFADADIGSGAAGGSLASVTITGAPNRGTLRAGTTTITTSNVPHEVSNISTLTYYQEDGDDEPMRDYARFRFTVSDGIESSAAATMRIDLGDSLRLRLRVFLEGPLR